jgi:two-component system KDP operon response regulator KdpE
LRDALECEGHHVTDTQTADETAFEACSGHYDLLFLDAGLDRAGAYTMCRSIRPQSDIAIIVLNETSETSAVDALNAGADEYLTAPFVMPEVAARVRAILRRVSQPVQRKIVLQDRTIDLQARKVKGPGARESHLTPKEFLVLESLITHVNKPRTHQGLAQAVWQRDGNGEVEYMRIVVKQLRRKLEPDPENPRYILTERAVGYRFHMPVG